MLLVPDKAGGVVQHRVRQRDLIVETSSVIVGHHEQSVSVTTISVSVTETRCGFAGSNDGYHRSYVLSQPLPARNAS
eukprot:COSAG06_NODE_1208_length_10261_cov_5.380634_7_plen_77_part_00